MAKALEKPLTVMVRSAMPWTPHEAKEQGKASSPPSSPPSSAPSPAPAKAMVKAPAVAAGTPPSPTRGERALAAPKNAIDFELSWKSLRDDKDGKWALLRLIDPGSISALLKNMLTGQIFFSLIECILTKTRESQEPADREHGVALLENIAQTPRFKINVLSIPSRNRKELLGAWEYHLESATGAMKDRVTSLAKLYGARK
mmetsp:Transcript_11131/g.23329  ORF Transcript_11131/g.23329 Transcript_11131/m.23329 type:complete len:201 (-) Transcript_11131:1436-2038(-)